MATATREKQKVFFKTPLASVSWAPHNKVWVEVRKDPIDKQRFLIEARLEDPTRFQNWEEKGPEIVSAENIEQAKAIAMIWFQNRESWLV